MIDFKTCPVCDGGIDTCGINFNIVGDYEYFICRKTDNGYYHFLYNYKTHQKCYAYFNQKLVSFANNGDISFDDNFGNYPVENIKSLDDYIGIGLLRKYYRMMAFV